MPTRYSEAALDNIERVITSKPACVKDIARRFDTYTHHTVGEHLRELVRRSRISSGQEPNSTNHVRAIYWRGR